MRTPSSSSYRFPSSGKSSSSATVYRGTVSAMPIQYPLGKETVQCTSPHDISDGQADVTVQMRGESKEVSCNAARATLTMRVVGVSTVHSRGHEYFPSRPPHA